jgi:hypothetical protein
MAKKLYDVTAKAGEYTDKTGTKKARWQQVGAVWESDAGKKFIRLARWFSPAGLPVSDPNDDTIVLALFEPKPSGAPSALDHPRVKGSATGPQSADDIPF